MTHVRQQIREAAADVLDGLATTGANVLIGRTRPLTTDHPPTLLIFTPQETARALTLARPSTMQRSVTLSVQGQVAHAEAEDCENLLDTIAAEVETAIAGDPTFGKLVKNTVLTSTVSRVEAKGDSHEGAIQLNFEVTYSTKENTPQIAI